MYRPSFSFSLRVPVLGAGLALALAAVSGCGTAPTDAAEVHAATPEPQPLAVTATTVAREPIKRSIRVTGTLVADEQAEVSAEIAGRIVATPVERGTVVRQGQVLVRISDAEANAQVAEAEANAAQVAAALNLDAAGAFDVERVPEVANARAELELARAEFNRVRSLLDQRVVSQSEYDQRKTRVDAAEQAYEAARNGARQRFRQLEAARARVALAREALSDTVVRAPFDGVVAERKVSVGDYVSTGNPVVTVVRIRPLRVALTVPEQYAPKMQPGQPVQLQVDAYADRTFDGIVRFVSPALDAEQRALTVEAVVPNKSGELKPGLFASALVELPTAEPALLVDARAVIENGNTRRVFVVRNDRLEERIVTIGQRLGNRVELVTGVREGERIALPNGHRLRDGIPVRIAGAAGPAAQPAG